MINEEASAAGVQTALKQGPPGDSGDDLMQAIVDLVGGHWARTDEGLVISCLKGMFGAASMAGNLLAIHSETIAGQPANTKPNGATFLDACAKLGDAAAKLTERTNIVFVTNAVSGAVSGYPT